MDQISENKTINFITSLLPVVEDNNMNKVAAKRDAKKYFFVFCEILEFVKRKIERTKKFTTSMDEKNIVEKNCLDTRPKIKIKRERYTILIL